jgi:hypothetical protein
MLDLCPIFGGLKMIVPEVTTSGAVEERGVPACRHHWVIQPATGPVSQGVCQICGKAQDFKNYIEASLWGEEKAASRSRAESSLVAARAAASYTEAPEEE